MSQVEKRMLLLMKMSVLHHLTNNKPNKLTMINLTRMNKRSLRRENLWRMVRHYALSLSCGLIVQYVAYL